MNLKLCVKQACCPVLKNDLLCACSRPKLPYQRMCVRCWAGEPPERVRKPRKKSLRLGLTRVRRKARELFVREIKRSMACSSCPETDSACLDFHHVDPSTKKFSVCRAMHQGRSEKIILAEIAKCIVLCANCHRKHHASEVHLGDRLIGRTTPSEGVYLGSSPGLPAILAAAA